ncbi:hypothetical protein IMG5_144040 [Ichthyophthirius multifiliis]|uniref:Transmembrane protein n=1 Tax=Ichthyophthirius multifiliis TaxID=5932 RepID=G0QXM9_ICHMU|nr:hypothetical protein IMG5_144040 [Ichthyophthirius multifiliis]EGR30029.1 hypothetical protein IMG5_144040 [Ichthyophthirius multifiliis]|eukprot:XP_004031265.1 hypothetical protein IMG5_144040 [Ichthyophthirius multifiliis]
MPQLPFLFLKPIQYLLPKPFILQKITQNFTLNLLKFPQPTRSSKDCPIQLQKIHLSTIVQILNSKKVFFRNLFKYLFTQVLTCLHTFYITNQKLDKFKGYSIQLQKKVFFQKKSRFQKIAFNQYQQNLNQKFVIIIFFFFFFIFFNFQCLYTTFT